MTLLRIPDHEPPLAAVRLVTELWKRDPPRPFARVGDHWELALPALPVDRLEYQLELERADGTTERVTDPAAPSVAQPFGDKSVLVLDGYRPPAWLDAAPRAGTLAPLSLESASLGAAITGQLWSPPDLEPAAPALLLVAHDGPEYVQFAALDRFLAAAVATGALPPLRAALLAPRARDEDYAASDRYADALAHELVPALDRLAPIPDPAARIGLGASLGALAMLHAHRRHPALFGALALQSGSFFDRALDGQESSYASFDRITAWVDELRGGAHWDAPVPVTMSCGTGEENLANNRAMARTLAAQGYPVTLHEVRDGHTWTCWRDAFATILPPLAG